METKVIKIDSVQPGRDELKKAAKIIDSGGLVAFPTETVYGIACKVSSSSLKRLTEVKNRTAEKLYTLHIGKKDDVNSFVPSLGLRAKKLIEKGWPGPLTIVFELEKHDIVEQRKRFDEDTFENLYTDMSIGIRCPANSIASELLQLTQSPVVAPSANITSRPPAVDANGVLEQLSGKIDMILDGGSCKYKKSSTVVKIGKNGAEILREGAYSAEEIKSMSQVNILFVCTGNTCRSPMAEGIFRKYAAEKLGCDIDRLERFGYKICSAGTMGLVGLPASDEAVKICAAKGVDITAHRSRALSGELIEQSDLIFAMSSEHCKQIDMADAGQKCILLAGQDIPDPIGRPQQIYDYCADMIEKAVIKRISELKL